MLNREPWLVPQDAFTDMINCYLEYGVLKKRRGYTKKDDTGQSNPIVGIMKHVKSDGGHQLMVADTKRLYSYASGALTDEDASNVWTGGADNFLSWENWKGKLWMVNDKDRLRTWDGTSTAQPTIDISGGGSNELNTAAFVFVVKRRMILLKPTESSTVCPQRARWCTVDDPTDWTNDEYADCPTGEWIRSACYLGEDVAVFFDRSIWLLKYTGDSTLPFRWEKVPTLEGAVAAASAKSLGQESIALSRGGLVISDGFGAKRLDAKVPDLTLTMNQGQIDKCFAEVSESLRQYWLLFPYSSAESPDRALVFNYNDGNWSQFKINLTCLGLFEEDSTLLWSDFTGISWEDYAESWAENAPVAGYPALFGGDATGNLYMLDDGGDDNGSDIEFEVKTGRWNPYAKQGKKARLQWIDFLVTSSANNEMRVDLYRDFESDPWGGYDLDFSGDGEKVWKRVYVGVTADFHRIRLSHTESDQRLEIHAIMPWFAPVGRTL